MNFSRRLLNRTALVFGMLAVPLLTTGLRADTVFVEAETFRPSSAGWVATSNDQTRRSSRTRTLWGADGPGEAVATKSVSLREAGSYRVWVRSLQVGAWRGPFRLSLSAGDKELAAQVFDLVADPAVPDWEYAWHSFDAELPSGDVTLTLSKYEQKNCVGYVRHVDCVLLTTDHKLTPDHLAYGPQTWMRVTLGEGYDRPVYLHLFVDHYRSPWYAHFAIGGDGIHDALAPPTDQMLQPGQTTPWCKLTPTVYQDSGAALNLSVRHSYHEKASRFRAKLEFGRTVVAEDQEVEVVKTFDVTAEPNGLVVIVPPDLESPEHVALLKRDLEFAEEVGRLADAFTWPTHGKRPVKIPYLATVNIGGYDLPVDAAVTAREQKTLDHFGFNGGPERILHGLWHMQGDSYCRPDIKVMRERALEGAERLKKSGRTLDQIAAVMLMDEPTGQAASFAAKDEAYREKFREWLQRPELHAARNEIFSVADMGGAVHPILGRVGNKLTPQALLVSTWDDVRPVAESEREQFPALHYYTQLFRTRAIGDFMATQRQILEEAYGRSFPTLVNFSDGAVYHANFCSQGIDYFELLDADDQNGIWGEDWANNSSTFQCGSYNVALMQAAARKRGQTIGHYLIAHAGRTPWDIKTKAVSETARGVRVWMNFSYGPNWGSHEGGPAEKSHLWHHLPELWTANAEISREIGAVEDWLLTARPAPAEVAILYSSSSDIWTMNNFAHGFDRIHTWLALTHAQTPVDILSERDVAAGLLGRPSVGDAPAKQDGKRVPGYAVCYLSGPNLTRAAAEQLKSWVESGGTLWLAAGAASRDEFNRPLETLTSLLPAARGELATLEPYQASGRFLNHLAPRDTVTWENEKLEVLSVKQTLTAGTQCSVLANFSDGTPAVVSGRAGQGCIIVNGFLPALSYIKPALAARHPLEQKVQAERRLAEEARLKASQSADQPEATNATASATPGTRVPSTLEPALGELLARSYNPWQFPDGIRTRLLTPVRDAGPKSRVICDTPLVDVVALPCDQGLLIALANYSLKPLTELRLSVRAGMAFQEAQSVRHGKLTFTRDGDTLRLILPLDASDFIMLR